MTEYGQFSITGQQPSSATNTRSWNVVGVILCSQLIIPLVVVAAFTFWQYTWCWRATSCACHPDNYLTEYRTCQNYMITCLSGTAQLKVQSPLDTLQRKIIRELGQYSTFVISIHTIPVLYTEIIRVGAGLRLVSFDISKSTAQKWTAKKQTGRSH